MIPRLLFTAFFVAPVTSMSYAQYYVEFRAFASVNEDPLWYSGARKYHLELSLTLYDVQAPMTYQPSTAFLTFASPTGRFVAYDNHPLGYSASVEPFDSSSELVDEVNGLWSLTIDAEGTIYTYQIDIALELPFPELPYLTSNRLVDGNQVGDFDWAILGGSDPISEGVIHTALWTTSYQFLDGETLPLTETSWSPSANLRMPEGYVGEVVMELDLEDTQSLSVNGVTSLTLGSPEVAFETPAVHYSAKLAANLGSMGGLLEGDYNNDGVINLADYTVWRDNLGAPAGTLPNDGSGTAIGEQQYLSWKSNFGTNAGLMIRGQQIPEPASWLSIMAGVAVFGGVRVLSLTLIPSQIASRCK